MRLVGRETRGRAALARFGRRVWARVPDEEPALALRLAFYLGGLACFGSVTVIGRFMRDGLERRAGTLLIFCCTVLGLAFFFLACRATVPRVLCRLAPHSRRLLALGLAGTLWLCVFGLGELVQYPRDFAKPHHYQNDATTNTYCAAQLALHGHNPYTDFYLVDCLPEHGLNGRYTTPLQAGRFAGIHTYPYYPHARDLEAVFDQAIRAHTQRPAEFESYISYPAGAFIFLLPFVALGWHDMSTFFLLWIIAAYLWLLWGTPRRLWLWLVPLAVGNVALWDEVSGGASDALDVFLILAGWSLWRRPWLSALLMGAAVAARQQGWFVAVFYAILVGRVYGWRALAQRLAVMAGVFALINLPYAWAAPAAWVNGVLGPLKDPMFPLGAGLVALGRLSWLPLWPRGVYTVLELAALACCALWYAHTCRRHPHTGLVLSLVPLVLAYRSLFTYLMPLAILALWAVLANLKARDRLPAPSAHGRDHPSDGQAPPVRPIGRQPAETSARKRIQCSGCSPPGEAYWSPTGGDRGMMGVSSPLRTAPPAVPPPRGAEARRYICRAWALLPDGGLPAIALRLAFYLGGLVCFGGVRIFSPYLRAGLERHAGILAVVAFFVLGMALFFLACRATVPHVLRRLLPHSHRLVRAGLIATLGLSVYGAVEIAQIPAGLVAPHHYQNDAVSNTACVADLFLQGHNPYTDFYLVDCLARNGLSGRHTTPLQAGAFTHVTIYPTRPALERAFAEARRRHLRLPAEFESRFSYPAGAFVFPAPFMALGWRELSSFYLVWVLLSYLLLAWWAPRRLRPWLVPMALGNISLWDQVVTGSSDAFDVFLILAGWSLWRRPWLSALLMGAAVAARQQGWFVAVFYAILVGRVYGWRALAQRLAVMAGVFAAVNAPFFARSPMDWIDGVLGPLKDPMFPLGAGLIALPVHGWLPLWPRPLFSVLEVAALAGAALWYARACRRHPHTGLVLALLPLALAWRSLFTYFVPLSIFCLWPLLHEMRASDAPSPFDSPAQAESRR